jgi:hypothetical protein
LLKDHILSGLITKKGDFVGTVLSIILFEVIIS